MWKTWKTFFFLSALLQNCFLCWNRQNGDVTPTLDAAMLCSSRQVLIWVVSWRVEELNPHMSRGALLFTRGNLKCKRPHTEPNQSDSWEGRWGYKNIQPPLQKKYFYSYFQMPFELFWILNLLNSFENSTTLHRKVHSLRG